MKKFLSLSFDDGTVQDRRFVKMLNKYGIKCTFNLNSGFFGQRHDIIHDGIKVNHDEIEADEVAELYGGHEIAVHTVTHPDLRACGTSEVIHQVKDDRVALEKLWQKKIIGMAYPGGSFYNEDIIRVIVENTGIRYARTVSSHHNFNLPERLMEWHPTCDVKDDRLFELADRFLSADSDGDMLFYVWGHSFEFDKYNSWERAERFFEAVSGKAGITYATNGEVAEYIEKTRG